MPSYLFFNNFNRLESTKKGLLIPVLIYVSIFFMINRNNKYKHDICSVAI